MESPVTHADLAPYGYTTQVALYDSLIGRAWRALLAEVPSLVDNIEQGLVSADTAGDAVIAAVLRVLRNPEGVKAVSGSLDDYTERTDYAASSDDIFFTAAERRRLTPAATGGQHRSGSLQYCR